MYQKKKDYLVVYCSLHRVVALEKVIESTVVLIRTIIQQQKKTIFSEYYSLIAVLFIEHTHIIKVEDRNQLKVTYLASGSIEIKNWSESV